MKYLKIVFLLLILIYFFSCKEKNRLDYEYNLSLSPDVSEESYRQDLNKIIRAQAYKFNITVAAKNDDICSNLNNFLMALYYFLRGTPSTLQINNKILYIIYDRNKFENNDRVVDLNKLKYGELKEIINDYNTISIYYKTRIILTNISKESYVTVYAETLAED